MKDEEICRHFMDTSQFISILQSSVIKFGISYYHFEVLNCISYQFSHLLHS